MTGLTITPDDPVPPTRADVSLGRADRRRHRHRPYRLCFSVNGGPPTVPARPPGRRTSERLDRIGLPDPQPGDQVTVTVTATNVRGTGPAESASFTVPAPAGPMTHPHPTGPDAPTPKEHHPMTPEQSAWFAETFDALVANVGQALLGKEHAVRLALTAMLAEGHLLLEDAPGTGKTSLAKALAATVQGTHNRIQFTPDLLPSDVTGVTIYDQSTRRFEFHPGPIFASVVLADEINRASPKTQSALLEVMEESQVTVDGVTHPVGRPFMVIATQNPIEQAGTYRLPEAQLDRFLIKTSLGYPDRASTVEILAGGRADRTAHLHPADHHAGGRRRWRTSRRPCTSTTSCSTTSPGSPRRPATTRRPRSARACAAASRSCAAPRSGRRRQGRDYVIPDDVKVLAAAGARAPAHARHRGGVRRASPPSEVLGAHPRRRRHRRRSGRSDVGLRRLAPARRGPGAAGSSAAARPACSGRWLGLAGELAARRRRAGRACSSSSLLMTVGRARVRGRPRPGRPPRDGR